MAKIENNEVERVSIRGTSLIGLNRNSSIARADYPGRYDFETTIGPDFFNTVLTMHANKKALLLERVSINDLDFSIDYLPPETTPWYGDVALHPDHGSCDGILVFIMRQQAGVAARY